MEIKYLLKKIKSSWASDTLNEKFIRFLVNQIKRYILIPLKSLIQSTTRLEINLIDGYKDLRLNIALTNKAIMTEEVIVTGERLDKNVSSSNMSQNKIEVDNIKQLPVILGEVDILKSAQLLPGIQSGGEGNSGLYVRGGGPDQNLILLDEASSSNIKF